MDDLLHFCCGTNILDGWKNMDKEVDIRLPLPFPSNSVSFIFIEHGIEHVEQILAFRFLKECHRILKPEGRIRIAFPDIRVVQLVNSSEYLDFLKCDSLQKAIEKVITGWEHRSFWTFDLMFATLFASGFSHVSTENYPVGVSKCPQLQGLEGHEKRILDALLVSGRYSFSEARELAKHLNSSETSIAEAAK
jgi:predicted SAM-dependent methyltransferase